MRVLKSLVFRHCGNILVCVGWAAGDAKVADMRRYVLT